MRTDVSDDRAAATWDDFVGPWMAMNHVRAATAIVAALLLTLWLLRRRSPAS